MSSASSSSRPAPVCIHGDRGRILLVDDDPFTSLVMQNRLQAHGYAVTFVEGPAQAEEALARDGFDLILSDIHMPGNHRLEWTETLLARPSAAPIMLMTGNPEMETACRAANLPVAGYLIKPPDWTTLGDRIGRVIAARHRRTDFVGLAREILNLVETSRGGPHDGLLVQRLADLAASFLAESGRPARTALPENVTAGDFRWRAALTETIAVIEKTRHSFRSKELGQLRQRLEKLLA
jgi:CheY-like chemotaxis protein